jgi:hypothetical protein
MDSSTQTRSRRDRNIHMHIILPVTAGKPARAARRLIGQRAHRGRQRIGYGHAAGMPPAPGCQLTPRRYP